MEGSEEDPGINARALRELFRLKGEKEASALARVQVSADGRQERPCMHWCCLGDVRHDVLPSGHDRAGGVHDGGDLQRDGEGPAGRAARQ